MRERRWSELDRCEMAKRMRMEREGWREVVGKLRGVNERVSGWVRVRVRVLMLIVGAGEGVGGDCGG